MKKVEPNSIVAYHGGGYEGCLYEWNYAYYDKDSNFHSIIASGRNGCETEEELQKVFDEDTTTVYNLDNAEDFEKCGLEVPVAHLVHIDNFFSSSKYDVKLTTCCSDCEKESLVSECETDGHVWLGGMTYAPDKILCHDCYSKGVCDVCGEHVGEDNLEEWDMCDECHEEIEEDEE